MSYLQNEVLSNSKKILLHAKISINLSEKSQIQEHIYDMIPLI